MSSLRLATASNVRAFQSLSTALGTSDREWTQWIDREAFEDETGRFRVWAGNLGALQKGHSSLDYRLRDSPLLSGNALRFLEELEGNLNEAYAIVTGARLPYEELSRPERTEKDEDDDAFFSEDEDEDDEHTSGESRGELKMRFEEIIDIIDNLYKLSVRIRTPTIRSRSLRAASYAPKDPDTGVDILDTYAAYDMQHIKELLSHLRHSHSTETQQGDDFLFTRLSAAITLRRRQFKYWKRHRDKLGASTASVEAQHPVHPLVERPRPSPSNQILDSQAANPVVAALKEPPSHKTGRTLLSGTEATHHHQSLDEIVDTKSVTSYAVTVKDIHGRGVELPPAPKAADGEKDFECPYCYIICPARYGRGRAWRTHLLQDLQPYCCTYPDCDSAEQLFRSRREWAEHEANHRKAWRCLEHPTPVYKTPAALEDHLRRKHLDSFPESQLATIVKVGETATADLRVRCPICYASANMEGLGDFQNHIANHLERIATFALPKGIEDDSDGASSAASIGRSGTSGSQRASDLSLPDGSVSDQEGEKTVPSDTVKDEVVDTLHKEDPDRIPLSADSLHQLPDESQNRIDMIADHLVDASPDDDSDKEDEVDETPAQIQEHLEQREAFRKYLASLPGAQSLRFYRRYGSWTGQVTFKNEARGAHAMTLFDSQRFPNVKIQTQLDKSKWKFAVQNSAQGKRPPPNRQSTTKTQNKEDTLSESSGYISYEGGDMISGKQPILTVEDIPTLRSLYLSRRLLQRDQSYAPNDTYNRLLSFCYHDLTRIRVDAIVNSTNVAMKVTKTVDTLNYAVFKAGGPDLAKEAKSKAKIKSGQVELTHGHQLPSAWVIHAARPIYSGTKGMGQFNILTECYRSALKMASNYELRTLAFPCIGTGGSGFPPRIAARIALQEVREYLDAHTDHPFERIIFCVNTAMDEKAYMDFFPVFFPPTHGDLDRARTSDWSAGRAALATQALEARTQLQKVIEELSTEFSLTVPDFNPGIFDELRDIDSALASIRGFLLGPKELGRSLDDLNLVCSVILTVCGSITETTELARDVVSTGRTHQDIWKDFNTHMLDRHEMDLSHFLSYCQRFVDCLDGILTRKETEVDGIATIRQKLESYGVRQKGQDSEGIRDHLDEVLYVRGYQREGVSHARTSVKLQQILSVSRLYQIGELEGKPTLALSSARFNDAVCMVRTDITRLEVDMIVNSTDYDFQGVGTLDHSVFKRGGPELREEVKNFGRCKEGDVKLTPGYLLPAKHILHVVPPGLYRKSTKDVIRKIYREILHTAMLMKVTSVAIPSIGTGMLNYPRRDSVSLAMEEVKRFLESSEPTNMIEKIIFVVYSANDEFVYKSLLPIYFPPLETITVGSTPSPISEIQVHAPSSKPSPTPRRSLFGSVGEALQSVRFGKQPQTSRSISSNKDHSYAARTQSQTEEDNVMLEATPAFGSATTPLPIEPPGIMKAEISSRSNATINWEPIHPWFCGVFVYATRIDIHGSDNPPEGQVPLLSLNLASGTAAVTRIMSTAFTLSGALLLESVAQYDDALLFRSVDAAASDALFSMLQRAINRSELVAEDEIRILPELASTAYSELASPEPQADALQATDRAFSPSEAPATIHRHIGLEEIERVNSIATQVLSHLTDDLKSRPGSYIGKHTEDIASALDKDPADISAALQELTAQQKVHNTIDKSTWVLSQPPSELPALTQGQMRSKTEVHLLSKQVLSHMEFLNKAPNERSGQTVRQLASALQLPTAEIWQAVRDLANRDLIHQRADDKETWFINPNPINFPPKSTLTRDDAYGDPYDEPPPANPHLEWTPQLDIYSAKIWDYVTFPCSASGERWTRIDKRLIDTKDLTDEFEMLKYNVLVKRDLTMKEVHDIVEMTRARRIRDAKSNIPSFTLTEPMDAIARGEASFSDTLSSPTSPTLFESLPAPSDTDPDRKASGGGGESGEAVGPAGTQEHVVGVGGGDVRTRERARDVGRSKSDNRRSWRDGRGEKDRRQAKLDRVLAGDMREDELRHYQGEDFGR